MNYNGIGEIWGSHSDEYEDDVFWCVAQLLW
jgi:hypothetical protein